jgi:hypothetical protein
MTRPSRHPDYDALLARADAIAAGWMTGASRSTSIGQERAILRLFGVAGLDREGRPLAAQVIERYLAPDPRRLAGGIALPFAIGLAEYALGPHELAQEVAAGNVDLGLEAQLLAEPDRRAVAVEDASNLARTALARVGANRTARLELQGLLGERARPWVGVALASPAIVDALDEARTVLDAGAGLVRVDVPPSRELAEHLARVGTPVEGWRAAPSSRGGLEGFDPAGPPIPSGAQRALAVLRRFVDEAGARHGGYVRLMTDAPPLAAPDQAVVAAFERIDLVVADPMREIVAGRVDPARALADHAFANRLLALAGTRVVVPAGPLLVTRDLVSGVPSDPAMRSGRSLALQLVAVAVARHGGLPAESIVVGALPEWLADEPAAPALAAAEVALRRMLLPGHPLAFLEPALDEHVAATWNALVAALLPDAGEVDMIVRRPGPLGPVAAAAGVRVTRQAASVAAGLRDARTVPGLRGPALEHREAALAAAAAMLASLEADHWAALVDEAPGPAARVASAGLTEAVAERTEAFDPLSVPGVAFG